VDELIRSTAWRAVSAQEGLRVLEEETGSKQRSRAAALCRKMQVGAWRSLGRERRGGGGSYASMSVCISVSGGGVRVGTVFVLFA
jgi:hypothetical protein